MHLKIIILLHPTNLMKNRVFTVILVQPKKETIFRRNFFKKKGLGHFVDVQYAYAHDDLYQNL